MVFKVFSFQIHVQQYVAPCESPWHSKVANLYTHYSRLTLFCIPITKMWISICSFILLSTWWGKMHFIIYSHLNGSIRIHTHTEVTEYSRLLKWYFHWLNIATATLPKKWDDFISSHSFSASLIQFVFFSLACWGQLNCRGPDLSSHTWRQQQAKLTPWWSIKLPSKYWFIFYENELNCILWYLTTITTRRKLIEIKMKNIQKWNLQ